MINVLSTFFEGYGEYTLSQIGFLSGAKCSKDSQGFALDLLEVSQSHHLRPPAAFNML